jgi:hypothetical protein
MKNEYPSAVDSWLAAVLISAPLAIVICGLLTVTQSIGAGIFAIVAGLGVGGLIAILAIPCRYTLTEESLRIKCGLLEEEIPLGKIGKAERSSSAWAAPALSLKRVKLTVEDGYRLISPRDRDEFIADLESRLGRKKTSSD